MKINPTILLAISIVGMASGQSARFRPDQPELHLLDVLKYTCTDIFPQMEHLNHVSGYFGLLKKELQPVCDYILKEADAPGGFDAAKFCNFLVDYLQLRESVDSPVDVDGTGSLLDNPLDRIVGNVTRNLYGIDINDPSTICPNADRFFKPSLWKLVEAHVSEFYVELFSTLIPKMKSICRDWKGYFASLGVREDSPHQQLVGSLLDVGFETIGLKNLENVCQKLSEVFQKDWAGQRMFSELFVMMIKANILDKPITTYTTVVFTDPFQMSRNITEGLQKRQGV